MEHAFQDNRCVLCGIHNATLLPADCKGGTRALAVLVRQMLVDQGKITGDQYTG